MPTPIEMIKQLRTETGAGVLDCRQALEGTNYSFEQALAILVEKTRAAAAGRAERQARQGVIELYTHGGGRIGVMVEINTETDFAGRSEALRHFAHETALQIAAAAPAYVGEAEIPAEVLAEEAAKAAEKARLEGKAEALIPRIVAGQIQKFLDQKVLLRQASIRDEAVPFAQLLTQAAASVRENIVIRRFARWELEPE